MEPAPNWTRMPYGPRVQFREQLPSLRDIYKALRPDEFRLLEIHGFDRYGILCCSLQHAQLEEKATIMYTAISYTWNEAEKIWYGDYDTSPKPIRINGAAVLVSDKVANILCIALQHGRTLVWIDSICINQLDLAEKSSQVFRMGAVFGCALEVLAILGSPSLGIDDLFENANAGTTMDKYSPSALKDGLQLWTNNYWRRAWVFQEIALARTIVFACGSKIARFDEMKAVACDLDRMSNGLEAKLTGAKADNAPGYIELIKSVVLVKDALKMFWKHGAAELTSLTNYAMRGAHSTFLEVLVASRRHKGCSNPRDVLYSRMAVALDASTLIPYPDYEMPVEELFKQFAVNHIVQTGSLSVVMYANETGMNLPTWVPDWTAWYLEFDEERDIYPTVGQDLALLTWSEIGLPRVSPCRTELMVQGRILNRIQRVNSELFEQLFYSLGGKMARWPGRFTVSEIPRPGDLICILRGYPTLIYLRAFNDYFRIVGRFALARVDVLMSTTGLLTRHADLVDGGTEQRWESASRTWGLASISNVQSLEEQIFRIQ